MNIMRGIKNIARERDTIEELIILPSILDEVDDEEDDEELNVDLFLLILRASFRFLSLAASRLR